jgi:hypothetical protein
MTDPAPLLELLARLQTGLLQAEAVMEAQARRIAELEKREEETPNADR